MTAFVHSFVLPWRQQLLLPSHVSKFMVRAKSCCRRRWQENKFEGSLSVRHTRPINLIQVALTPLIFAPSVPMIGLTHYETLTASWRSPAVPPPAAATSKTSGNLWGDEKVHVFCKLSAQQMPSRGR